jgi:hypothetical protein
MPAAAASSTVENATAALAKAELAPAPRAEAKPAIAVPPRPERAVVPPSVQTAVNFDDPEDAAPSQGAVCKRPGCGKVFAEGMERQATECVAHAPGASPIFHEGSKARFVGSIRQSPLTLTTGLVVLQTPRALL